MFQILGLVRADVAQLDERQLEGLERRWFGEWYHRGRRPVRRRWFFPPVRSLSRSLSEILFFQTTLSCGIAF